MFRRLGDGENLVKEGFSLKFDLGEADGGQMPNGKNSLRILLAATAVIVSTQASLAACGTSVTVGPAPRLTSAS
ncbi:hypothetical protein HB774_34630 (plasmid) [Rhizobium leguminosarum bv. viciae]|nr:hypothetical protein HB774_34630 [Rhizobium leguminosarum bv. viciae]